MHPRGRSWELDGRSAHGGRRSLARAAFAALALWAIGTPVALDATRPTAAAQQADASAARPREVDGGELREPPEDPPSTSEGAADPAAAEELAVALQNPLASLISVPIQSNFQLGVGPNDDFGYVANIQPVVPIPLPEDWTLISRTIVPVVSQPGLPDGPGRASGLGDILQSLFVTLPQLGPLTVGAGPAVSFPSATHPRLGTGRWGAGPTAVVLAQVGGFTGGMLANHLWSFAGEDDRRDVSLTFVQPFVSYTFDTATTLLFNTESAYDWHVDQWTVPLTAGVTQVIPLGPVSMSIGIAGQYYVEAPESGPEWGIRVPVSFVLPPPWLG